jgi:hypothetical protein
MLRSIRVILLVGFAIFLASRADASSLVLNGGFETGDFTDWTAGSGILIDTVFPNSGTYDAEFGNPSGSLSQSIATTSGASYTLSFALLDQGLAPTDTFNVSFGSFNQDVPGFPSGVYNTQSFIVTGTGSPIDLIFQASSSTADWNLDDVSLVATTPVPPSLLLFATGILLWFGLIAMRRQSFNF